MAGTGRRERLRSEILSLIEENEKEWQRATADLEVQGIKLKEENLRLSELLHASSRGDGALSISSLSEEACNELPEIKTLHQTPSSISHRGFGHHDPNEVTSFGGSVDDDAVLRMPSHSKSFLPQPPDLDATHGTPQKIPPVESIQLDVPAEPREKWMKTTFSNHQLLPGSLPEFVERLITGPLMSSKPSTGRDWEPGDRVKITKPGTFTGCTAVVVDPFWKGMIKVRMESDGAIKSYKDEELERLGQIIPLAEKGSDTFNNRSLFVDKEQLKKQVRQRGKKKDYNVTDFYKKQGCSQYIARSGTFEVVAQAIIACNTIWIGVELDWNNSETLWQSDLHFILIENLFCWFFSLEIIIRFLAFQSKRNCLKDAWFVFDATLVFLMITETYVMAILLSPEVIQGAQVFQVVRLVKMLRLARLARLLRAMPELVVLVKGIFTATKSVSFVIILLTIIVYVFAVALKQLLHDRDMGHSHFRTVAMSMETLIIYGLIPDNTFLIEGLRDAHWWLWPVIIMFILLATITVMNMLIGVLVGVVDTVAAMERESSLVTFVKDKLYEVMHHANTASNSAITKEEFERCIQEADVISVFKNIGVDVVGLVDLADFIFMDYGTTTDSGMPQLTFEDFLHVVIQLRGDNTATVKDVILMQRVIRDRLLEAVSTLKSALTAELHHVERTMVKNHTKSDSILRSTQLKSYAPSASVRHHHHEGSLHHVGDHRGGSTLVNSPLEDV
jgi:voltage-gated sodium channel